MELDSEKLKFYPDRVQLLQAYIEENDPKANVPFILPITIELSPTRTCNFRCIYCAVDYRLEEGSRHMSLEVLENLGNDFGQRGLVWAGEGEPTLWPELTPAIERAAKAGFRQGLSTNGTNPKILGILRHLTWCRFTVDAVDPELYMKIHGTNGMIRAKVFELIEKCAKENACSIGVQAVVFDENALNVPRLAHLAKELGVQYFVAKPYSRHPKSLHLSLNPPSGEQLSYIAEELRKLSDDSFLAVWRWRAAEAASRPPRFSRCWAAPFFAFVDVDGLVYPCVQYVGDKREVLGDLNYQRYYEIVRSNRWQQRMKEHLWNRPVAECRRACRLYSANDYLDELLKVDPHHAFL